MWILFLFIFTAYSRSVYGKSQNNVKMKGWEKSHNTNDHMLLIKVYSPDTFHSFTSPFVEYVWSC